MAEFMVHIEPVLVWTGWSLMVFVFFQAEDGIRDIGVTGVQTCALPILIEQPAIELLESLGWPSTNCFAETFGDAGTLGRKSDRDVILTRRLLPALKKLNPTLDRKSVVVGKECRSRWSPYH